MRVYLGTVRLMWPAAAAAGSARRILVKRCEGRLGWTAAGSASDQTRFHLSCNPYRSAEPKYFLVYLKTIFVPRISIYTPSRAFILCVQYFNTWQMLRFEPEWLRLQPDVLPMRFTHPFRPILILCKGISKLIFIFQKLR